MLKLKAGRRPRIHPEAICCHDTSAESIEALKTKIEQTEAAIAELKNSGKVAEEIANEIAAKEAEIQQARATIDYEALKARNDQLEAVLLEQQTKDAETAVKAAVSRGALPPKDDALQAKWRERCIKDPANIELLNGIKGSVSLSTIQPRLTLPSVEVRRESSLQVLNHLGALCAKQIGSSRDDQKKIARDFADIYAREILPRLKEGDDMPLRAASNSLGSLTATLVSTRTLELLTLTFPILSRITSDFSDQIVSFGDTLKTRVVSIPSVTSYNQSTGWSNSAMTTTDVSITYDNFKGVLITIDAQTMASTVRRLFDEIAPAQAYALGKDIVDFIYTKIVATAGDGNGFSTTPLTSSAQNFGRPNVIDMAGALDDNGNPEMGRTLLLARPYYSALAKDNAIITLAAFQRAAIIEKGINSGTLPDVEGFAVYKAVNLPATAIGGQTLKGFGFTRSALVVASRLTADYVNALPGANNGTLTVITTPSGFSANQIQYVNHTLGTANQNMQIIYGATAGQDKAGVILTDA